MNQITKLLEAVAEDFKNNLHLRAIAIMSPIILIVVIVLTIFLMPTYMAYQEEHFSTINPKSQALDKYILIAVVLAVVYQVTKYVRSIKTK